MLGNDGIEYSVDSAFDSHMKEEEFFETPCEYVNAVFEIGFSFLHGLGHARRVRGQRTFREE